MTDSAPPSVISALGTAYRIVASADFTKSKEVPVGRSGYRIIPIAQILDVVRKAHAETGIIVVFGRPEFDPSNHESRRSTNGPDVSAVGHVDAVIYGPAGDSIEVTVPCEAKDTSDKLTNKLMTNAMRNLYRTLYAIDADDSQDPEEVNTPNPGRSRMVAAAQDDPFFGKKVGS